MRLEAGGWRSGDDSRVVPHASAPRHRAALLAPADALTVALVVALAACSGTSEPADPLSQGGVVLGTGGGAARDVSSSDAWVQADRSLAAAEAAWQAGDPLTTIALVNQALVRGVPPELEARFRELRARARSSVVAEKVVQVRVVPVRDVVADGEAVPVRIVLRNVAAAEFRSPRSEGGSSDALFVLEVSREDRDLWGNVRTSEFLLRAPVERDLVLPPGGEREVQVTIGADLVRLEHGGFSVIRIGGSFRPVVLRVGDSEFFDSLPVEPALVRVLQKGYEPLAADPLESLRRAIAKRSPPHVVTAAELLPPTQRGEARVLLRAALESDPPLEFCIRPVLARLDELDGVVPGAEPAPAAAESRP